MGGLEEHLPSYAEARREGPACEGLPLPEHLYVNTSKLYSNMNTCVCVLVNI